MEKLKPCPFCSREVKLDKLPLWNGSCGYRDCYEYRIQCKSCGCSLNYHQNNTIYYSDNEARKNVVEKWNRRVKDEKD